MAFTYTHKPTAKLFGAFFLVSFVAYGLGAGLIESVVGTPDVLASVHDNQTAILVGALLMALVHSFTNIGLPVLLLRLLKPINATLAYGYLSAAIAATVILVVGVIFLLLLVPLSNEHAASGAGAPAHFETMAVVLREGGFYAYQIGMAIWGVGGLMLCAVLYQSELVPRLLSVWGLAGYLVFIAGTVLEIFGYSVGVLLSAPGGLFEIALSLWLIVKGFRSPVLIAGRGDQLAAPRRGQEQAITA
jgi:hypothetical protein